MRDGGRRELSGAASFVFESLSRVRVRVTGSFTTDLSNRMVPTPIDPVPYEIIGEAVICDVDAADVFPPRL